MILSFLNFLNLTESLKIVIQEYLSFHLLVFDVFFHNSPTLSLAIIKTTGSPVVSKSSADASVRSRTCSDSLYHGRWLHQ